MSLSGGTAIIAHIDTCDRVLSSSTLDALKQFYSERDAQQEKFARLQAEAEQDAADRSGQAPAPLSMDAFTEDWNESQFWVRLPGLF